MIDSRVSEDGATIRRRRECEACGERFSTLETIELKLPAIIKSDGRRDSLRRAQAARWASTARCRSGPVSEEQIETAVRAVVHQLRMTGEREVPSRRIGEFVMAELRKLDHVAYVRFASVYRAFEDVADFREEIERLERDLPPARASCRCWARTWCRSTRTRSADAARGSGVPEGADDGSGIRRTPKLPGVTPCPPASHSSRSMERGVAPCGAT